MKKNTIIDILMYILLILLMAHHIIDNQIHEILGTILFILFIIHHILNIKYYKTIFKGKYTMKRKIILIIDILLLIAMISMIISAINISNNVFSFLNIDSKIWGRKLHILSVSWAFIIISIHVGMHINVPLSKIEEKKVYYLLLIFILIYGMYSFIKLDLIKDMLLINTFKIYDFSEPPIVSYLHVLSVSLLIILTVHLINNKLKRKKEKNE